MSEWSQMALSFLRVESSCLWKASRKCLLPPSDSIFNASITPLDPSLQKQLSWSALAALGRTNCSWKSFHQIIILFTFPYILPTQKSKTSLDQYLICQYCYTLQTISIYHNVTFCSSKIFSFQSSFFCSWAENFLIQNYKGIV